MIQITLRDVIETYEEMLAGVRGEVHAEHERASSLNMRAQDADSERISLIEHLKGCTNARQTKAILEQFEDSYPYRKKRGQA